MREHVKEIGSSSARIQVIEAKGGFFAAINGAGAIEGVIVGQNHRSENRRLPEWPITKTADDSLGPPEINLHIPLIH